jgi:hypothetical protein
MRFSSSHAKRRALGAAGAIAVTVLFAGAMRWRTSVALRAPSPSETMRINESSRNEAFSGLPSAAATSNEPAPQVRSAASDARRNASPAARRPSFEPSRTRAELSPEFRAKLVKTAERELDQLEVQEPANFLAMFDMLRGEHRWDERIVAAAEGASHEYILARMNILARMLHRFIDDPESDHSVESDALAALDDAFAQKLDTFARDVPAVGNIRELLTSTSLKTPAFIESPIQEAPRTNE